MPKTMKILPANLNLIGMISSTEVRRRINDAKMQAKANIQHKINL